MSRAFINKGEQWGFCAKSGDHCMYAEPGKECHQEDCEFLHAEPKQVGQKRDRIVTRNKNGQQNRDAGARKTRPATTKAAAALKQTTPAQRRRELSQLREKRAKVGAAEEIDLITRR